MFELIALAAALIGGFAAGLWDLKTTDIPDEAPALMTAFGLFLWFAYALTTGNWMPFMSSAALGTMIFAVGWGLYRIGQWGGGDAALLAGTFFLLPDLVIFTAYIFNFFCVALVYMIIYSVCLGFLNPEVFGYTYREIIQRKIWVLLLAWTFLGLLAYFIVASMQVNFAPIAFLWAVILGAILFYVYAKNVERRIFRRSIPASKLKIGDVLASSKRWEGVTASQIAELRRKHKTVRLKEGVRFGLVFPITLVVTMFLGNLMFWLVGIV